MERGKMRSIKEKPKGYVGGVRKNPKDVGGVKEAGYKWEEER
jgi:hypothetical protein